MQAFFFVTNKNGRCIKSWFLFFCQSFVSNASTGQCCIVWERGKTIGPCKIRFLSDYFGVSSSLFSPVGVPGCRPGPEVHQFPQTRFIERTQELVDMGVVVGRVGDWPENEAGEGRVGAGLGGCPSRGWSITERNGRGIEAQKERWLKARLEFPSILSGGKFSCSLVHDFRANEYRGQGVGYKGIRVRATDTYARWLEPGGVHL